MSSETSAQWPVVAPGFMYIVKMGDYTHILQPADQKSSEHLNLAQLAIRDINVARKLLEERGPFLLLDRQEKMDEMITETETAINRVIRILEPARVEHISEQSIRFNTRNPWALENDPKSAATFGRLQITHNALKTVVHDLNNIEATVQQDNCNDRAEAAPVLANGTIPEPEGTQKPLSKGATELLTWKRSRRAARHVQTASQPSASGSAKTDPSSNDVFSPVSPEQRSATVSLGQSSGRLHRDSVSEPDSSLQPDSAVENASDTLADHLPVIHELEGGNSIVQLGPVRSLNNETEDLQKTEATPGKSKMSVEPQTNPIESKPNGLASTHHVRRSSSPPALRVTPPTLKQKNPMKRETFAELRQRNKKGHAVSESAPVNGFQPAAQQSQQPPIQGPAVNEDDTPQAPSRFRSLKAKLPLVSTSRDTKSISNGVANRWPAHVQNATPPSRPLSQVPEEPKGSSNLSKQGLTGRSQGDMQLTESAIKSSTYPPVRTQILSPMRTDDAMHLSSTPSNQILSPSRSQLSPLEQIQSPNSAETAGPSPLQPHERAHQIFAIDPELTRLPSLLRATHPRKGDDAEPLSSKRSESIEMHLPKGGSPAPMREPLDRSFTAPQLSSGGVHEAQSLSPDNETHEAGSHLRSMSDTAVPQLAPTCGPTHPRKPVPNRHSPLPSREPSPHIVSRITTPSPEKGQSQSTESNQNLSQRSQHTSEPPSPVQDDNPRNLALPMTKPPSTQSLSVQAPSTAGSSRKSSVSAEEALSAVPSKPVSEKRANGLAMNPPEVPERQTSAYQAQKIAVATNVRHVDSSSVQAPDYRSPAWQQSRHYFDPGHNVQLEQTPASEIPTRSRFRDEDQSTSGLMNATRSTTVPEPMVNGRTVARQAEQQRRVTGHGPPYPQSQHQLQFPSLTQQSQAQSPPGMVQTQLPQPQITVPSHQQSQTQAHSPPQPTPSPKPSIQNKQSFLHHQAAKLHARQLSSRDATMPAASAPHPQQALQPQPLRLILPPTQPPERPRTQQTAPPNQPGSQSNPPPSAHFEATIPQNSSGSLVKDKDLFTQQLFRPNSKEKRPTPPRKESDTNVPQVGQASRASPPQSQPQPQLQPQQQQQPQNPPQKRTKRPSGPVPMPIHHCDCPDPGPEETSKPTSSESLKALIKMNNQLAQNVPSIPTVPMRNEGRASGMAPPQRQGVGQWQQAPPDHSQGQGSGPGRPSSDMYPGAGVGTATATSSSTGAGTATAPGASMAAGPSTAQHKKKKSWLVHQAGKIAGRTGV